MKQVNIEKIQEKIFVLRKTKVMFDFDLAELYGVKISALNQAVKRNLIRFPDDFMFQLTKDESDSLRSQIATLKGRGQHRKFLPYAFTQNGIAMLSSVLKSQKAIEVNIRIMRVFAKTSELLRNQVDIYKKIEAIEKQGLKNSEDIQDIFQAIKELYGFQEKDKHKKIGFDS